MLNPEFIKNYNFGYKNQAFEIEIFLSRSLSKESSTGSLLCERWFVEF